MTRLRQMLNKATCKVMGHKWAHRLELNDHSPSGDGYRASAYCARCHAAKGLGYMRWETYMALVKENKR